MISQRQSTYPDREPVQTSRATSIGTPARGLPAEGLGVGTLPRTFVVPQVSIRILKQIHTATHPGRPISRTRAVSQNAGDARDLLLAALDTEADEGDG